MKIELKTPFKLWIKELGDLRESIASYMKTRITVPFSVYYVNQEDEIDDDEYFDHMSVFQDYQSLSITSRVIDRYVTINIYHDSTEGFPKKQCYIKFSFYSEEIEDACSKIGEAKFLYGVLRDPLIYEEIAKWINGGNEDSVQTSVFLSHTKRIAE